MFNLNHNQESEAALAALSRKTLAVVFSLGTVFGTGVGVGYQKVVAAPPVVTALQSVAVVAADDYDKIHKGMTLTEVRSILGPGIEMSWSETTVEMEWSSSPCEGLRAMFEQHKLATKKRLRCEPK